MTGAEQEESMIRLDVEQNIHHAEDPSSSNDNINNDDQGLLGRLRPFKALDDGSEHPSL